MAENFDDDPFLCLDDLPMMDVLSDSASELGDLGVGSEPPSELTTSFCSSLCVAESKQKRAEVRGSDDGSPATVSKPPEASSSKGRAAPGGTNARDAQAVVQVVPNTAVVTAAPQNQRLANNKFPCISSPPPPIQGTGWPNGVSMRTRQTDGKRATIKTPPVPKQTREAAMPSPSAHPASAKLPVSSSPKAKPAAPKSGPGRPRCSHGTVHSVSRNERTEAVTAMCAEHEGCKSKIKKCPDCGLWDNYNNFWRHQKSGKCSGRMMSSAEAVIITAPPMQKTLSVLKTSKRPQSASRSPASKKQKRSKWE